MPPYLKKQEYPIITSSVTRIFSTGATVYSKKAAQAVSGKNGSFELR